MESRLAGCGLFIVVCLAAGCDRNSAGSPAKSTSPPPASVPNAPKEDQLNTFELTEAAAKRLGIETTPVEKRSMVRMRMYGGEITLPTGASLVVTAPLAGFLRAPTQGGIPQVGEHVSRGQALYELVPRLEGKSVLSPSEKVSLLQTRITLEQAQNDAEGQVQQTGVQVEAAKIALERAERLLREQAGTARAVDEAQAALSLAEKQHAAALSRKKLVDAIQIDEDGMLNPLVIEAPREGIIRVEHAVAGEAVAAGAPLFEVMNSAIVWVKVPVYVGEIRDVAANQPARISGLEDRAGAAAYVAKPVPAPPTALALSSTADLYYEVDNRDGRFRPGQKLNANLPLSDERESLVLPWSAVVVDINGGAWVYEQVAEHKFSRRRVQVRYVVDATAVLAAGPPVGAKIVTQGAAELFGTEFFVSK
ncbi:MAG: efflux RND transporter periplasmic adaptor subunit [Planctomycetia bacterium]|nr:efflux RND transporter periplasmic adaptor subunit [Planctomycetia bacterium]